MINRKHNSSNDETERTIMAVENMTRGIVISFEGIDGTGKSTQIDLLEAYLNSINIPVTKFKNPGGTIIGEQVRSILLDPTKTNISIKTELFLNSAAFAQAYEEIILPALESGKVILIDRFIDSPIVYQGIVGGVSTDLIRQLVLKEALNSTTPNLTFLLDMPAEYVEIRTKERSTEESRIDQKPVQFHNMVRQGFLELANNNPDRIIVINAVASKETIQEIIRDRTMKLLGRL